MHKYKSKLTPFSKLTNFWCLVMGYDKTLLKIKYVIVNIDSHFKSYKF